MPVLIGAVPKLSSKACVSLDGLTGVLRNNSMPSSIAAFLAVNLAQRSSFTRPISRPFSVRRISALSWRSNRRYSLRLVIMRYGSLVPFVTRSSMRTPMYASERARMKGSLPSSHKAALIPAIRP